MPLLAFPAGSTEYWKIIRVVVHRLDLSACLWHTLLMESTLVFVYNANSGIFNGLLDWAHKILSPQTYACNLCAITYDNLGMRRSWRDFLTRLPMPVEFLHRDELRARYGIADADLPAAYRRQGEGLELWISAAEINACHNLEALQELIASRVIINQSLTKS